MAELYAKPYEVIDTGYNPQQTQQGGQDAEMQSYLESLPPEERQKAIERINAPLSGEELALMAQSGQRMPTLEDFAEIEKYHKNHEISFIDGLGKIAEGGEQVMTDLSNAMGSFFKDPADATSKMPATAVEAFAQGTRNFYGMLAQSGNPDSTLFRVKDFLNGSGTIEDRYNQYMEALKFNKESADLAEGKMTMVMDKDMINHEVTQAMAYIADPTLFIPFGKVASSGLRAVGLGEKLALAGARSAAIKNGIIGNTLKWGAGQPLEFMGGAVRNTIDYGLEKAGAAFEATTGIGAKEFAQTARMSGIGFSASAVAGHAVPYASTISDAYLVGSSAKGFGEALTLVGETMKNNQFGRGVRSWAAESLKQAEKNGVALSPHAKGLLKTLDAVDPLFAYGWNGLESAAEGAMIGGGLGYLSGGEEGMYSGIGAGVALGAIGGTAGKVVADVTGGTNIARRAVQAKMTIEGHKVINPEKSMFFQAMQKAAEARGKDIDLVNSIIIGIDEVAPNFEFHALTPEQFVIEAQRKGYNPETGKFRETSALDVEFGGDRASKSKAMYVLRSVGADFVGNRQGFLDALKKASAKDSANPKKPASNIPLNLRKYTDVAKTFEKLSKTQQEAVLKEIDGQANVAKELGGTTKLREFYDALTWSEAWTDSLVKKFESDREGARKDIADMLAQETDKKGKLTSKGRALTDKLRAEGFLDKEGKLLRERNLLQADLTFSQFEQNKGAVIGREADGKTHMYINLNRMGDETFPHELFHTIMRESPMKKHFTDSLVTKLLGTVDKDGNLVRPAEVNIGQVTKFFKKYIDLTHRNPDGTLDAQASDAMFRQVQDALTEYQNAGGNKKISDKARGLLENYSEEFGAYYFSHWLMGRNRNTLFFGGELKGIEGLVERTKDSFMDFWQSKISKTNPEFDFTQGLNASFDRSKGLGRIGAIDYYMRDMVRAASNANREAFRPDAMTLDNLKDFERSNGIRNLTSVDSNRRLNPREQVTQNIRLGKEAYKILSGLDKNLRTSKDVLDENGKQVITGRLSESELDALVKGGIVPRAWADKVNQGYAMLDGTISNIFSAGYLGKTEQTTDASYPRLTGKDVAFKNRKAVLFDVETKIKADGTFYTLFHTLDLAVIEQEANRLFQNTDYRALFDGDRAVMEADFFRYLSNASRASTDPKKLDSAALLEKGDGLGAKRRDVLHQMGRMALQTGDAYKHQPIAVIPEGIRHSVTTFNIDGMTMPRVETGTRYDIDMKNAHKFIRENWQPDEMKQEKTPTGVVMTHETGFKFTKDASGRVSAYTDDGSKVGTFGSIKEATTASKNLYNKAQDNIRKIAQVAKQKEVESRKNLQPLDEAFYEEAFRIGDMFKTKRMQEIVGNSKLVRQTFDEFLGQKVEEINSGKNEQEKGAIMAQLFNSEFKELIDLEAELKKTYDEFGLEASQLQAQETEITKRIVEFSQEKQRLQESGNPEAKVDIGILDMYGRIYKRKEEVNKRLSEIANKMHNEGITDLNSHYYITKRFLERFKETGKLSEEAIKFVLTPRLIKEYEANFETGKAVTFLANHGTPNHELMVSKTFNTAFLGRNTGSMSAFNATFFAGSKETSVNYVGNPIAKTWVRDFIQARKYYVNNFSPELKAKLESLLSSDTSKGVVQKVSTLMANAHIEFPNDFKLKDTGRKTKDGEPIIKPKPETQQGYDIDGFLDRALEGANDEGFSIGGYEMAWKEEGRKPYLLRNIVKMDNPYVHEYAKADYRDETFASVIQRAKEAGHDGVIFKNTKDGGGLDTIFASFAKNEDNKIFTLETTEDTRFVPRGNDEAGNKVKGGSEIEGRNYQPSESWEKTRELGMKSTWNNLPEVSKKLLQLNIDTFGLTNNAYEAGYLLPDARMLDFSGRSQTSGFKRVNGKNVSKTKFDEFKDSRQIDHREAVMLPEEKKKMQEEYGWEEDKIGRMQQAGAIRIDHNDYGTDDGRTYLDIGSIPTNKQYEAILDILKNSVKNKEKHTLGVDIRVNGKAINHPLHDVNLENPERVILALKREVNKAYKNNEIGKDKASMQPAEGGEVGGRTYTPEQFKTKFIGRVAAENPERIKDLSIKVLGKKDSFEFYIYDKNFSDTTPIGEISTINKSSNNKDNIITKAYLKPEYRGKGFGKLLYSELGERLRSVGIENIEGTVTDLQNRPFSIRASVFGKDSTSRMAGTQDGVTTRLDPNARYQPDDYQGGDDYYKKGKRKDGVKIPKQYKDFPTSPEGVDEFGAKIRYVRYFDPKSGQIKEVENFPFTYMEIGHEINSKNVFLWSLNNANFKKYGVHENSPITIGSMASMMRDKQSPFHGYGNQSLSDVRGRIEMPVLDEKGNITEKGRVSIGVLAGAEGKVTLPQFRLLKEKIIKSLGLPALTEKDFDFWLYTADRDIRSQFGLSEKDKGGIKFQPDEGGRTYNDKQMSGEFIGRYASENPKATKGLKPKFNIFSSGDEGNIELVRGQDTLGYINFSFSKATGDALIEYTRVADKHQGKGYGNLLYSELVERLRSMGMKEVQGMIIDEQGRPQKIRERIIDKENARIGGDKTQIDYVEKDPDSDATQTGVTSYLYNDAWYQPDEPSIIGIEEMAEARRLGDLFKTKQMREFVGDRKVVPQTADEGFTDFINNFKQADINQDTALMMLDEMSKNMFGGLDRQTLRLKYNELIEKTLPAWFKKYPREKEYFERAKLNRGNDYTFSPEKHEVNLFTRLMSSEDANQFIRMYRELENPVSEKQRHSGFTRETAETFAKKIEEARKWVNNAMPSYNDFAGYLADNVPMREYYQHAVYSKKFRTGEPVVVVGVHGTYTSQGFLKDKKYKHDLRTKDLPLSEGEKRGAYFAASDATVLSSEYQGYDPKKLGYEISQDFRRPESDTPNIAKSAIRFDNPLVVDGQQTAVMKRTEKILGEAIAAGHDGVIYINQKDGGGLDVSFIIPVETANKQQRMIGSTLEKNMEGNSYEPLPRGEGLTNRTANLQPDEYIQFTTEQTASGRILKNAKGYAIIMVNNKFRVYNPTKAILGVYNNEEEAKKRIYREIPKR